MKTVLLIGTLDTKGQEYLFVKNLIEARGHKALLMNAGVFEATISADISAEEVARAGGESLESLRSKSDRGHAVTIMKRGVEAVTKDLFDKDAIQAVLGLGGSGGTILATAGMRTLPVGVPKLMVSTLTSGDIAPYVDIKDICMMYSVVDIAGINQLSSQILSNAAGMICGALEQAIPEMESKPLIAATMFGVTTPCVTRVREKLESEGYEVLIFHATGSGGRAMEGLIRDGFITAVADITTTEWCDELVGGVLSAGKDRLEAAANAGISQVVSVGALDMVNFWAMNTVPERFKDRKFYKHNENVTLMRTTAEENAQLGKIIAEKINAATGPTMLILPLKGVSMIDAEGQAFYSPEADAALFASLREHLAKHIKLVELDAHINDDAFASAVVTELLRLMKEAG
ncbi:MAG: Tm-1-like ATP-binding domain-containing protein [Trueperaceae bacterium]|nr:Tm-1-like ATP-binding domain-containing protein [Trueperaceae bacterium]